MKKIISLLLCLIMVTCTFPVFASSANDYDEAVNTLIALDILKGDENGNLNLEKSITRAEFATLILRVLNIAPTPSSAIQFTDVANTHWAHDAIYTCYSLGIINGCGNGTFQPERAVSFEEAVKMVMCALGYEPMALSKGGYPAGYIAAANFADVIKGVSTKATRGDIAQLIYNALSTPKMAQTSYGSNEEYSVLNGKNGKDYETLLTNMDIYIATGIVGNKEVDTINFTITENSDDGEFIVDKKSHYDTFKLGDFNMDSYLYQQVDLYVKKVNKRDYIIKAVHSAEVGETLSILSDDIYSINGNRIKYYVNANNSNKTKDLKISDKVIIDYNKDADTMILSDLENIEDAEIVLIDQDSDNVYDVIVVTKYESTVVDYVDYTRDRIGYDGKNIGLDFDNEDVTIILCDEKGRELSLDDFEEDDVIAVITDANVITKYNNYIKIIRLSNSAVIGTIDETYEYNDKHYVVIDGEEYVDNTGKALAAGSEGIFYIGLTGKIIAFDGSAAGGNYAYILEGAIANETFSAGVWQVKLLTKDNKIVTYNVKENATNVINHIELLANGNDKFLFEDIDNKNDSNRFVDYKVNSRNELIELNTFDYIKSFNKNTDIYNEDAQSIARATLENDAIVFCIDDEIEDCFVTNINYLIDDAGYTGFAIKDEQEYRAMVITDRSNKFSEDLGFAIVTKISYGKDNDDNDIIRITYAQNEEEDTIIFEENPHFNVGDVFLFVVDSDNVVTDYITIATIVDNDFNLKIKSVGKDTEFRVGYILNDRKKLSGRGEIITIEEDEDIVVLSSAYKYTYDVLGRKPKLEIADFMYDVDYAETDGDDTLASPILIKEVDGVITDIYSINSKIKQ